MHNEYWKGYWTGGFFAFCLILALEIADYRFDVVNKVFDYIK